MRWGFDADHRQAFKLGRIGANTWRSGLDRVLLGVAMAEDGQRLFAETLPLDDVESGDIELAGRLAEFVERLHSAFDGLAGDRTMRAWAGELAAIADSLTTAPPGEAWQRAELTSLLDRLVDEAKTESGDSAVTIGSADVRSLLAERLKGKATRANFCTGHLTVCTLVPMRSIPHKVVCLLGLDDGSFPRHIERDGDDLTAQDPRVGDRDARSEDRQLLLDALLAAREHLVITYSGHDERSNQPRPPAVPVGELFDVVDHTVRTPAGRATRGHRRPAPAAALRPPQLRARASSSPPVPGASTSSTSKAPAPRSHRTSDSGRSWRTRWPTRSTPSTSTCCDRFLRDPVKVFLRERLGVSLWDRTREYEDAIPIDLGRADQVGDCRADPARPPRRGELGRVREGRDRRGALPPASLADPVLDEMQHDIEELVRAGSHLSALPPDVARCPRRPAGPPVRGRDGGRGARRRHPHGDVPPDAAGPADERVAAPPGPERDLPRGALRDADDRPGQQGLAARRGGGHRRTARPDPQTRRDVARAHLAVLVELFRRGMREPLPLYCKTSAAYAADRALGREPGEAAQAARKEWESRNDWDNENRDKEQRFVLGEELSFPDMVTRDGDSGGRGGRRARPPRAPPVRRLRPHALGRAAGVREAPAPVTPLGGRGRGRGDARRSTSAVRCRGERRCSRRVPAPARPSRSPR